ncbi:lithostathine-1-like [Contarinia nasturtii]|uniref:lithostathine-1-like n=1 Tax=Contarinia nasturtii TaxID=265458 RepID=UPI0012D3D1B2|nr:lithostathine-1-like [Contarinia nasturtii]
MKVLVLAVILLFNQESISGMQYANETVVGAYHIFTTRVNWMDAIKRCHSRNMTLISILTERQNNKIIEAIKKAGQGEVGFWTSGNRRNRNGTFHWENGEAFGYTNWEHGTPDNLGLGEECVEIKGYNILKWNDHYCTYNLYYICEINIKESSILTNVFLYLILPCALLAVGYIIFKSIRGNSNLKFERPSFINVIFQYKIFRSLDIF